MSDKDEIGGDFIRWCDMDISKLVGRTPGERPPPREKSNEPNVAQQDFEIFMACNPMGAGVFEKAMEEFKMTREEVLAALMRCWAVIERDGELRGKVNVVTTERRKHFHFTTGEPDANPGKEGAT